MGNGLHMLLQKMMQIILWLGFHPDYYRKYPVIQSQHTFYMSW